MNHPPPHQPGPYGPPGAGGFPPPQPPQPPPSAVGFPARQPYGPPPSGGYGYPGGPPPKTSNTGLIVGVILALVLVAGGAVAVTGFWQPGFFLSDEKTEQDSDKSAVPGGVLGTGETQPPAGQTGAPPPGDADAPLVGGSDVDQVKQVAEQAATAINTRDESLAESITCDPQGKPDFSKMPADMKVEVTGEPMMDGSTKAKVPFNFTAQGRSEDESLRMEKQEGRWCIY